MRLASLAALAAAIVAAATAATAAPAAPSGATLEGVVILSRHGVRAAVEPNSAMRGYADQAWPKMDVPVGNLTKQGRTLARLMGGYYGARYRDLGLLPSSGCLPKAQVDIWADNMQRTLVTAEMLGKGMLPGCSYPVGRTRSGPDPWIDPVGAGICSIDDDAAEASVLSMVGGSWTAPGIALQNSLGELQDTLQCCRPRICSQYGLKAGCTLTDIVPNGSESGAIGIAANLAENFVMQYATGLPMSEVGWGRLSTPNDIGFVNQGHALAFWAANASPYLAAREGSNLANRILSSLSAAAAGSGPKVSIIVAHDNNLLNVAGLLGVQWFVDSYQQNHVPPGSALAFELWKLPGNRGWAVEVNFFAQTLDQLRDKTRLTLATPPTEAPLTVAACKPKTGSDTCTLARLEAVLKASSVQACIRN